MTQEPQDTTIIKHTIQMTDIELLRTKNLKIVLIRYTLDGIRQDAFIMDYPLNKDDCVIDTLDLFVQLATAELQTDAIEFIG